MAIKILEYTQGGAGGGAGDDGERDSAGGGTGGQREQMEALLSAQLSHPNVVSVRGAVMRTRSYPPAAAAVSSQVPR